MNFKSAQSVDSAARKPGREVPTTGMRDQAAERSNRVRYLSEECLPYRPLFPYLPPKNDQAA